MDQFAPKCQVLFKNQINKWGEQTELKITFFLVLGETNQSINQSKID